MKDVLERVERKLIIMGDVYGAINYLGWTIVLGVYMLLYVLIYAYEIKVNYGIIMGIFWSLGMAFIIYLNAVVWKKIKQLRLESARIKVREFWGWVVGLVLWFLIPMVIHEDWSLALGFLLFIIGGNLGLALSFKDYRSTPPVITSLLAIPLVTGVSFDFTWAIAVLFANVGYAISAMLYLLSSFSLPR